MHFSRAMAKCDFNRDGRVDIVARSEFPLIVPEYRNVAEEVGLSFRYQNASAPVEREFLIFQALGGGVACIDFDRDGNLDFYFGQAATDPPDGLATEPNALFRNFNGRFANVVASASADDRRYTVGVTAGDWNQDGFPDLLLGNLGANQLLINQGDGTFRVHIQNSLGEDPTYTTSLAIADVTGDALPDIFEDNSIAPLRTRREAACKRCSLVSIGFGAEFWIGSAVPPELDCSLFPRQPASSRISKRIFIAPFGKIGRPLSRAVCNGVFIISLVSRTSRLRTQLPGRRTDKFDVTNICLLVAIDSSCLCRALVTKRQRRWDHPPPVRSIHQLEYPQRFVFVHLAS